jgi:murein DD-endopeptidase MepM/ murein hydrolase activator NlpD
MNKMNVFAFENDYVFRVHLNGEFIGYIEDEVVLFDYINLRIEELEKNLKIEGIKEPQNISTEKTLEKPNHFIAELDLKEIVNQEAIFTVVGYDLLIDNEVILTASSKELIESSLKKIMEVFTSEEEYADFLSGYSYDKTEYGDYLDDVFITNTIQVRQTISSIDNVLIESKDIIEYLLFGKDGEEEYYEVKAGEDLSQIADLNELSISELLVANPHLYYDEKTNQQSLLVTGEKVKIDLLSPLVEVVVERHIITEEVKPFTTEFKAVEDLTAGYSRVVQEGVNGSFRSEYTITIKNGETVKSTGVNQETLLEPITRIIEEGITVTPSIGNPKYWRWPSNGTWITSPFGWRRGSFHAALDIAGASYNTPIYAANNGYVQDIYFDHLGGWQVLLNHGNGWYTVYAHLASNPTAYVSEGEIIFAGKIIGGMGATGTVSGIHLHFEVWKGGAPYQGGVRINPNTLNYYY